MGVYLDGSRDIGISRLDVIEGPSGGPMAEPFVPDRAVVARDIGVLLRLSGLDVLDRNPLFLCPSS